MVGRVHEKDQYLQQQGCITAILRFICKHICMHACIPALGCEPPDSAGCCEAAMIRVRDNFFSINLSVLSFSDTCQTQSADTCDHKVNRTNCDAVFSVDGALQWQIHGLDRWILMSWRTCWNGIPTHAGT